jgi:hypothetical protein
MIAKVTTRTELGPFRALPTARYSRFVFGVPAVASRAYSKWSIGVGELDAERGNVNDCTVDEVLRRHRS